MQEDDAKEKSQEDGSSVNPFVLFCVITMSLVFSVMLALYDFQSQEGAGSLRQRVARKVIADEYFPNLEPDEPLHPYQQRLREAQWAHTRKDVATERRLYREVLALLRAERKKSERGLTGSRSRDIDLEELVSVLLGDP